MSYPPPHPPSGGPVPTGGPVLRTPARRPVSVVLASVILIGMGLTGLAYGIASLIGMAAVVDRFRSAAAGSGADRSDIDALVALIRGGAILAAVVGVFAAILLISLAVGNLRGVNGARIATWAVSALGVLCGCCGLLLVVVQRGVGLSVADDATARELLTALGEAYPTWWIVLGGLLSGGQAFGYLVVSALLALPGANAYYRMSPSPVPSPPSPPSSSPSLPPSSSPSFPSAGPPPAHRPPSN